MGRRFIVPVVAAAATMGLSAGPALASTHHMRSLSNGSHKLSQRVVRQHAARFGANALLADDAPPPYRGNASVVRHGANEECTVPGKNNKFTNINSRDTAVVYDDTYDDAPFGTYVGTCSADLNFSQTIVPAKGAPYSGKVAYSHSYSAQNNTYGEVCILTVPGNYFHAPYTSQFGTRVASDQLTGDAESIAFTDGEFVETCIANDVPLA